MESYRIVLGSAQNHKQYKCLTFLAMLYVVIIVTSNLLTYKMVHIFSINMAAASLVFPFTYFLGDVIAEVYGYQVARMLIWYSLIILLLFALASHFLINLPSPTTFTQQSAYDAVIGPLPRIFMGDFVGIIIGALINAYAISKWKILFKGKYFWIRSLCSTSIGALAATGIAFIIMYSGILPPVKIASLIAASCGIKLSLAIISISPITLLVFFLKKKEGLDVYDFDTDFNPFKLSIKDSELTEAKGINASEI